MDEGLNHDEIKNRVVRRVIEKVLSKVSVMFRRAGLWAPTVSAVLPHY